MENDWKSMNLNVLGQHVFVAYRKISNLEIPCLCTESLNWRIGLKVKFINRDDFSVKYFKLFIFFYFLLLRVFLLVHNEIHLLRKETVMRKLQYKIRVSGRIVVVATRFPKRHFLLSRERPKTQLRRSNYCNLQISIRPFDRCQQNAYSLNSY